MHSDAQIDPRIAGYLGRALSLELSAVQQYATHASLTERWGMQGASKALRQEVAEESRHVERVVDQMIALGVAPNASQLRPVRLGRTLPELLLAGHALEQEIISLYQDAVAYCARIGDAERRQFFGEILQEELHHAEELANWLRELGSNETSAPSPARA